MLWGILCVVFFLVGGLLLGSFGFPSACWTPPPFFVLGLVTYQILWPSVFWVTGRMDGRFLGRFLGRFWMQVLFLLGICLLAFSP